MEGADSGPLGTATFTLKQDGEPLTGTVSGQQGDQPIKDGRVSGNRITFVRESPRGKQTFTEPVAGDEIKFKRTK